MEQGEARRASSASPGCKNPTAVLCLPQPGLWDVVLKAKIAVLMECFPSCVQQCEAGGLTGPRLEALRVDDASIYDASVNLEEL